MIKKLDKLILKAFIGPFLATFFIAFVVLVMQNLWKYIDDLVGKGLDFITIGKFLWYAGATLLTLSMPIAILISSIMTFGNLGESFELVAIKSSGISLLRFMRPIIWVSVLLCFITFLFANYAIPYANLKFKTLYYDIKYKRPALDLQEGTFFTAIPNYAIKVGKKEKDGKTIHDVVIFEQQNSLRDNSIIAKQGVMKISDDQRFLEFILQNGTRYQERGNLYDTSTEFIITQFKEYKKLFDLSSLALAKTSDSIFKNDSKMRSVRQLGYIIDSVKKINDSLSARGAREVDRNFHYLKNPADPIWKKYPAIASSTKNIKLFPDSLEEKVYYNASYRANSIKSSLQYYASEGKSNDNELRSDHVEWHRKFSLSFACLVLFFIGAPLGSIIRKGGFGMPLVFAIIFFLVFHLLNMFGEKFAREGILPVYAGMWLPVLVLSPVGIFLTYKAMHDSQLFNKEFYNRLLKRLKAFLTSRNKNTAPESR
ncbi:LptF/LptG family permease [Ferruginibacter albus]|uniref:LptF/LptG family permease n=1 Tax=Ferruginibacter albus TaxID=2875540 RepID=UPI001CC48BF7|nr:LptF/LptG family permease [Ferruginibacter albus]UAY51628.1 LptF/LptG family permease [Ferruginibacter albus]